MAKTVDERIVEMRFDNKQFEDGVAESRKSIQDLQKTLDTTTGEKAFEGLNKAAQNVDFSAIAAGVEALQSRFSTFGIAGMRIIENLTDKAMALGGRLVSMTFGQIKSGGKARATNIENAKFSMLQLLKDASRVDEVMKNVDASVTGTAYGMDQAAKAASVLVSSGFKEGQELEGVLKSIAGVTATANADYDSIAHIFQNIAGQGRIMGQELNEFAARGLNIAEDLAEYYREVKHEAGMTAQGIRELMSDPKTNVTSKDFFDAMLWKYEDAAFKANETLIGVTNNIKSALSRIGADFYTPLVAANNDIIKMLNTVRVRINDIRKITTPYAQSMAEGVLSIARAIDKVLTELDVGTLFRGIANLARPLIAVFKQIASAFKQVFPPKGLDNINESIKAFANLTAKLQLSTKTLEHIRNVALMVFRALKTGITILKTTATTVKDLLTGLFKIKDTGLKEYIKNLKNDLKDFSKVTEKFSGFSEKLAPIQKFVKEVGKQFVVLGRSMKNAFSTLFKGAEDFDHNFFGFLDHFLFGLKVFAERVAKAFGELTGLDVSGFTEKLDFVQEKIQELLVLADQFSIKEKIGEAIDFIKTKFEELKTTLQPIADAIKDAFKELFGDPEDLVKNGGYIVLIGLLANKIRQLPVMLKDVASFMQTLENFIGTARKSMENMFLMGKSNKKLFGFTAKEIVMLASAVTLLSISLKILSTIDGDKIVNTLELISGAIIGLVGAMLYLKKNTALKDYVQSVKKFTGKVNFQSVGTELIKFSIAVLILAKAMEALSNVDVDKSWSSLGVIAAAMAALVIASRELAKIKLDAGITKSVLIFAVAVNLLVKPIKTLAEMRWQDALQGVGFLAVVMAELVGAMVALDKLVKYQASFKSLGGLLAIAVSVRVLTSAMQGLASLSWAGISKGIIAVGLALAELIGAVKLMDADTIGLKASIGLIAMAVALKIIANAIISLASVPFEEIGMAFSALTLIIGELIVFCLALKDSGLIEAGASMVLIAIGIKVLASAINDFAGIPFAQLAKGIGAFTVIMAELFMFIGAMDGMDALKAAASILIMSVAIKMMAEAINSMGQLRWQDTVQGLVGMAGAMTIMAVAAAAIAELGSGKMLAAAASVLIMAVAVKMIASAITAIGNQGGMDTVQGLLGIVAALGILATAAMVFSVAAPELLLGAVVMAALGAAMLVVSAACLVFNAAMAGLAVVLPILIGPFEEFGEAILTYLVPMQIAVGTFAALGAAALILGAGAIVAGAGLLVFSAGLMGLSAGIAVFDQIREKLPEVATSLIVFSGALAGAVEDMATAVIEMTAFGIAAAILGVGVAVLAASLDLAVPFIKAFSSAMESIRDAIETAGTNIDLIAEGLIKIGENGDAIKNAFLGMAEGLLQVTRANLANTANQISILGNSFDTIAKSATTLKDDLTSATTTLTLFQDSVLALNTNLNDFSYSFAVLDATLVKLQETSSNVFMNVVQSITNFCTEIQGSMEQAANTVATTAQEAAQNVLKAFSDKLSAKQGNWLGENIMRGLAQGIRKNIGIAVAAANQAGGAVNKELQKVTQVNSPSKFAEWVGENVPLGLAVGIEETSDKPVEATNKMANEVNDAVNSIDLSKLSMDLDGNIQGLEELQNMDFSNLTELGNVDFSNVKGLENVDLSALDLKDMMNESGAIDINKFSEQMGGDAADAFVKGVVENNSSVQNLKKRWNKFIAEGQTEVDAVSGESYKAGEQVAESYVEGRIDGTKQAYAKLSDEELIKMGIEPPKKLSAEDKAKVEEYNRRKARAATEAYLSELEKNDPGAYWALERKYYEETITASMKAQTLRIKDSKVQEQYTKKYDAMLKNLKWGLDNVHNSNEGIAKQAQKIVDKYQQTADVLDQMGNPKIIPVVDLTNVENASGQINKLLHFDENGKMVVEMAGTNENPRGSYSELEYWVSEQYRLTKALADWQGPKNGIYNEIKRELENINYTVEQMDGENQLSEIFNTQLQELNKKYDDAKASNASKEEQAAIKNQITDLKIEMKNLGIKEEDIEKLKSSKEDVTAATETAISNSAEKLKTDPTTFEPTITNAYTAAEAQNASVEKKTYDERGFEINSQMKDQQQANSDLQLSELRSMKQAMMNPIPVNLSATVSVTQSDSGAWNGTVRQNDKFMKRTGRSRLVQ